jgi:hypothetical protein
MKFTKMAKVLLTGLGVVTSGVAAAATEVPWTYTTTIGALESSPSKTILDSDADIAFSLTNSSLSANLLNAYGNSIGITFTEVNVAGHDVYDVGLDFSTAGLTASQLGSLGTGSISYSVTSLDPNEGINSMRLDSSVLGSSEVVTKTLASVNLPTSITLTSKGGNSSSTVNFNPLQSLQIVDTFTPNSGDIFHVDNQLTTAVPEPSEWVILGFGFPLVLNLVKRRRNRVLSC